MSELSEVVAFERSYMTGQCHVYAVALHRLLGYGFILLVDKSEEYSDGVPAVHHVYAVDNEGNAYDFNGVHSAEDAESQWMEAESSTSDPDVVHVTDEAELAFYVELTVDGWHRPLSRYQDKDVEIALLAHLERFGESMTALKEP